MFLPGILRPLPCAGEPMADDPAWPTSPFTVLRGREGSTRPERVATVLDRAECYHDCVWLRPGPGASPRAIARLLADACRHRWSGGETDPAEAASLPDVLARARPGAVVVLELDGPSGRTARRVVRDLHAACSGRPARVVVLLEGGGPFARPGVGARPGDSGRAGSVPPLPERYRDRLHRIAGERSALTYDVAALAGSAARDDILGAIATAGRPAVLRDRVADILLDGLDEARRRAVTACLATGYWHPQLLTEPLPIGALGPCVIRLESGWGWLRPMWARALRRRLEVDVATVPAMVDAPWSTAPVTALVPGAAADPRPETNGPSEAGPTTSGAVLDVRLLGEFEVRVDGVRVERWRGQKGPAVLRFLLSRPRRACTRDALIEEFWPDVAPEVARNRLQVAVSGLRRSLRGVTGCEVLAFVDGEYRIHPDVRVDLDVDRFDAAFRRAEAGAGQPALDAYRDAIEIYRGDFAADAPFESWTLVPRESLRLSYVDALDRICRLHLAAGRLDEAITTGHRMLETDPCREDAHRMLMDCYRRLGRTHQVVRQYELCARVLRTRLDVDPDPATTRLYRSALEGSPHPRTSRNA